MRTDFKVMGKYWKRQSLIGRWYAWQDPNIDNNSGLFSFLTPDGTHADPYCGCATQVSNATDKASHPELTTAIQALGFSFFSPISLDAAAIDRIVQIQELTHKFFIEKGLRS